MATGNGEGIELFGGQFGSHGNRVSATAPRATATSASCSRRAPTHNRVSGNSATGNRGPEGAGILVFNGTGNVIDRQRREPQRRRRHRHLRRTPGTAAGNTISSNTANRNTGHGVNVVDGTIDGGGNEAAANGTPPDCVGVLCA